MIQGKYSLEFNNAQHMMMFENHEGFTNLFCGQDWTVYISKSEKRFVTSDNPVVVVVPERVGFYGPTFLERTHCFALTPEICIEARYPRKETGKKIKRKLLFKGDEMKVLPLNMILASQAHEYAYATDKQSLEDILEMAKRFPFPQKRSKRKD